MSFAYTVWDSRHDILLIARYAIAKGMLRAWNQCLAKGRNPGEVDFLAELVLTSAPILYRDLQPIFQEKGFRFSLSSVFCHGSPLVTFDGMIRTSSCEIGDLLIIHLNRSRYGEVTRNALLYQAKVSSDQPCKLRPDGLDQLSLYTKWPKFKYVKPGVLNGMQRDVTPKSPHLGAQYMLIDKRHPSDPNCGIIGLPGTYPIGSCLADEYLCDHNPLEMELLSFLRLCSGRPFADMGAIDPRDDWSRIIWDLLSITQQKASQRRKKGLPPRQGGGPAELPPDGSFFASPGSHFFSDDVHLNSNLSQEDEGGGVSVMLLETSEQE
jgi:hypothetical protein